MFIKKNVALVNISDFFQNNLKSHSDHKVLNGSAYKKIILLILSQ